MFGFKKHAEAVASLAEAAGALGAIKALNEAFRQARLKQNAHHYKWNYDQKTGRLPVYSTAMGLADADLDELKAAHLI